MGFQKQKKDHIFSPVKGKYVHLKAVADPTFSSGVLGAGFGIEPDADVILAPVEGTVSMVFPTGHAIGFTTDNGLEVLVHIGIDTVGLDGKGFEILKKQGERVMAHEKVIRFNRELIKKQGLDSTVMVVFTNGGEYDVKLIPGEQVTEKSELAVAEVRREELKEMKEPSKYEYGKMCSEILEAVGGSKNIKNVFHCITRLRIVPVNRELVDLDKLNHVSGLLKVIESSGQLQCVVGTSVPEVYADFLEISGIKAGGEVNPDPAGEKVEEKRQNLLTSGLNTMASCVTPGLYAIVAGGMIKGIISLITALGLVSSKSDIIVVLNAVGDAPFYFMPFIIGYAAAKRFKVKEIFGIMTAGILMYSTFLSPAEEITGYQIGLFTIPAYNYKGSIFPVILSVWIFSLIFHFIDKRMPKNLKIVFSGSLSFLIAAPLFLGFAAPLGNWIAMGMTGGFAWLFNHVGPFAGALFCGIIPLTIIFGIKGWSAVELQNLSTLGYDYMLPNFFYSNLAVSGAVLAYALKMKAGEQKSTAISTGLVCILGITEPALYGIALPEKKPLFAAMAGGAIAGAVAVLLGVVTYAFSMPGITSIATYMDDSNNFLMLLVVMVVAWVSSFAISFVLTKKES
nr:glucose PTS transporter subunit IIA [uncultured Clostridium sp.]